MFNLVHLSKLSSSEWLHFEFVIILSAGSPFWGISTLPFLSNLNCLNDFYHLRGPKIFQSFPRCRSENDHRTTEAGRVHFWEHSCENTYSSEHGNNICAINCVRVSPSVCLLVYKSIYPFVHVCGIWCVWCAVVKHNCLPAISFAYLSQPVLWVSDSMMHGVFHWQLWYSWSPTVTVTCASSAVALAGVGRMQRIHTVCDVTPPILHRRDYECSPLMRHYKEEKGNEQKNASF